MTRDQWAGVYVAALSALLLVAFWRDLWPDVREAARATWRALRARTRRCATCWHRSHEGELFCRGGRSPCACRHGRV